MIRTLMARGSLTILLVVLLEMAVLGQTVRPFRPPAVPLVTHDPYFSVWSAADRPTDDWSRHWTGSIQAFSSLVRVDGKPYRLLGKAPANVPAMQMMDLDVTPTRTVYAMTAPGVRVMVTFCSPLLPHDLDTLARPVSYLSWEVISIDGQTHDVALYFDSSAEVAVNKPDQKVAWERSQAGNLDVLRVGSVEQPVLAKAGDNLRIDWGYFYLAAPRTRGTSSAIGGDRAVREGFAAKGTLPLEDDSRAPRAANDDWPVLAFRFDLGSVRDAPQSRHLLLAYDELYAIEYFHQKLRPYWRRSGQEIDGLLRAAESDYAALMKQCRDFDLALEADLSKAGGWHYVKLCALAFRQCLAAHTLVADAEGKPLFFSKENFSNGCIDTVDVTYPSSPFFLLFNPELLKAQLRTVLDYARSGRWKFPFAPHDLGTYPKANGQVYGGGEKTETDQMPVEECGNMLIMLAALAKAEGNAQFSLAYWPLLETWAGYLNDKGLDPENQLCTDDFAGHLAHNTNLSLKAIEALGGFALVCDLAGKLGEATAYRKVAKEMATRWAKMADDGDHYRLAFDKPGTWSQKYNLVWDKILGLDLFPPDVARKEVAFYLSHQNEFGLPLDNRSKYTKLDWVVWTATLADSARDFASLVDPLYHFADRSPSRVPLTDWYWTHDAKQRGFQARSVVGGIYIKLLADPETWKRWLSRRSR
jgi:hypothetical protein